MARRMANRLTTVSTSLVPEEAKKIKELAQAKNLSVSELCREGMQWYLANQDKQEIDNRETLLEKRMRKMEERMASLMAKIGIDAGMIIHILYRNMDKEKRNDVIAWAYNSAVARLRKKLGGQAIEIKEQMAKADDKDSSKTQLHKGKARKGA